MDQVINTGDAAMDRQIAEEIRAGMESGGMKATISPAPGGGLLIRAEMPASVPVTAAGGQAQAVAMPPAGSYELGGTDRASMQAALVTGDVQPLLGWLAAAKARGEWSDVISMTDLVAPAGAQAMLDAACQRSPQSPEARLVRSAFHLHRAWEARGSGTADTITDEGSAGMVQHAELARQDLLTVMKLDPASPAPYALFIEASLLHDRLSRTDGRRAFEEAIRRHATCIPAYRRMLLVSSEKWGGSHAEEAGVARAAASQAGACPDLLGCLFAAQIEIYHYKKYFEQDDNAAEAHLRNSTTLQELNRAFDAWLTPRYQPGRFSAAELHCAAAWYFLIQDRDHLRPVMQKINMVQCRSPWHLIGEPSTAFAMALQMSM